MSELVHAEQHKTDNERPMGRFLKSRESDSVTPDQIDGFRFACNFVYEQGFLLHKRNISFIAKAQMSPDEKVEMPLDTPDCTNGLWLELDSRDSQEGHEQYTWHLSNGRDEYQLQVHYSDWQCTHVEKDGQGSILRRRKVEDETTKRCIEKIIESIITHPNFITNMEAMSEEIIVDMLELQELQTAEQPLDTKERKKLVSLKSALFGAGFPAGSVDRSHIQALIS